MSAGEKHTGFAIALAWPETFCKQPGSWYDTITGWFGINQNNFYRVGHAAVVLIDNKSKKTHYFDFGRYHAPFQYGRVRSAETDHELKMETLPVISADNGSILNYKSILSELQNNKACHGEGELYASYAPVNFEAAFLKANQMQESSPIPYGPFRYKGSNCSRFVNTVILAGKPNRKFRVRLKYIVPLTPTPMNNVNSLDRKEKLPNVLYDPLFYPVKKLNKEIQRSTLLPPARDSKIPENAQWLSGEGAGSWFVFEQENAQLKVSRYSPSGIVECEGYYKSQNGHEVSPDSTFQITYPSNCKEVLLKRNDTKLRFERVINK